MDRKHCFLSSLNCRFYNPVSSVKHPFKLRWEENRMFSSERLLSEWIFGISIHGKWLFKSVISPYGDLKVVFFSPTASVVPRRFFKNEPDLSLSARPILSHIEKT